MDLRYGAILRGVHQSRFENLGALETSNIHMCIDLFKRDSRWEIQELDLNHPGAHPAAIIRMKSGPSSDTGK
jgi:hypothetical protein